MKSVVVVLARDFFDPFLPSDVTREQELAEQLAKHFASSQIVFWRSPVEEPEDLDFVICGLCPNSVLASRGFSTHPFVQVAMNRNVVFYKLDPVSDGWLMTSLRIEPAIVSGETITFGVLKPLLEGEEDEAAF